VLRNRRELVRRDRVGRTGRGTARMTFLYIMKLGMKKVILFTNWNKGKEESGIGASVELWSCCVIIFFLPGIAIRGT
jgi:hypothetical protein